MNIYFVTSSISYPEQVVCIITCHTTFLFGTTLEKIGLTLFRKPGMKGDLGITD